MKTLIKWTCSNCRQGGDLVVDLPANLNHLDELVHGEHHKSQSRRHCMCPPYGVEIDIPGAIPHVEELKDAKPVVLYLGSEEDREQFIAAVQAVKPGLTARKL